MRYYSTKQKKGMQFIFRIPSMFVTIFVGLILVSQFTMRYYLENPRIKGVAKAAPFSLRCSFVLILLNYSSYYKVAKVTLFPFESN